MGLGGILQELKTEGVLALYHDYRSGRLVDYSGNGNNGIATAVAFNKQSSNRLGITSRIEVPQNATINITSFSIITNLNNPTTVSFQRIASKRGVAAGSVQFEWLYWNDTVGMYLFSDVAASYLALTEGHHGNKTEGLSITSGAAPTGYRNGVFRGSYTVPLTIVAQNVDPLTIANANVSYVPGGFNTQLVSTGYFLLFSRSLTATEHARVYGQLENMTWNTKGLTPGPMMP
jgi:hypothetical protein